MSDFSYNDMSEIVHAIKQERQVVCGAIARLTKVDVQLQRVQEQLDNVLLRKDGE